MGGTRYSSWRYVPPLFFRNTDQCTSVIGFATLLHGFTPRLGVYAMNVGFLFHIL